MVISSKYRGIIVLLGFALFGCYILIYHMHENVSLPIYNLGSWVRSRIKTGEGFSVSFINFRSNFSNYSASVSNVSTNLMHKAHDETRKICYIETPKPQGRLGNYMFQLAGTLGIADIIKHIPTIQSSHPLLSFFDIKQSLLSRVILTNATQVKETNCKTIKWRTNTQYLTKNLSLRGYFQSWKNFVNSSAKVRDVFTIKRIYLDKAKNFLISDISQLKTIIGIHVRRGDYLSSYERRQGRLVADRDYIKNAIKYFQARFKNCHFVVCSDDMKWSKDNIRLNNSEITFSIFREPIIDMAILSLCNHVIMTAGSFGWWGGWLSGGTVVYFDGYPVPGSVLDKWCPRDEYYPPGWIGMNGKTERANTLR